MGGRGGAWEKRTRNEGEVLPNRKAEGRSERGQSSKVSYIHINNNNNNNIIKFHIFQF